MTLLWRLASGTESQLSLGEQLVSRLYFLKDILSLFGFVPQLYSGLRAGLLATCLLLDFTDHAVTYASKRKARKVEHNLSMHALQPQVCPALGLLGWFCFILVVLIVCWRLRALRQWHVCKRWQESSGPAVYYSQKCRAALVGQSSLLRSSLTRHTIIRQCVLEPLLIKDIQQLRLADERVVQSCRHSCFCKRSALTQLLFKASMLSRQRCCKGFTALNALLTAGNSGASKVLKG